jgi:hypothetical protein
VTAQWLVGGRAAHDALCVPMRLAMQPASAKSSSVPGPVFSMGAHFGLASAAVPSGLLALIIQMPRRSGPPPIRPARWLDLASG